eukprot:jgi/Botrbrau1/18009/Bobra.0062s0002.1
MGGWELLPDEVLLSIFAACSAQERQWTLHQVLSVTVYFIFDLHKPHILCRENGNPLREGA